MNKEITMEKVKGVLSVLAGIAIAGCIAVFIPAFRSALIMFGETLVHRQLRAYA
jgi:hypothetical protein